MEHPNLEGLTDVRSSKIRDQDQTIADLQLRVAALEQEIERANRVLSAYKAVVDDMNVRFLRMTAGLGR